MKNELVILLLLTMPTGSLVAAETNSAAAAQRTTTDIFSDTAEFFGKSDDGKITAVYRSNVRVEHPRLTMTTDLMTIRLPKQADRPESMISEGNVDFTSVDSKGTNYANCDKAVYSYKVVGSTTNELIVLTGKPKITTPTAVFTAESLYWDLINEKIWGDGRFHMELSPGTNQPSGLRDVFNR